MKPQPNAQTISSAPGVESPRLTPKTSGTAFTVAVFVTLVASLVLSIVLSSLNNAEAFIQTNAYVFLAYLLPPLGLFVTILLVCKSSRVPFSNFLSVKKSGFASYCFAFGVLFGLLFGFGWLNTLFIRLLGEIGYQPPQSAMPHMDSFPTYLLAVLIIACLPALGEELLFRGVMVSGLKGESLWKSVLLCGVCFSVFHQNPAQTPYQLLCGAVFALILFQTENLLLTILMHFLNNFWILTAQYANVPAIPTQWELAVAALGMVVFFLSIGYFCTRPAPQKRQSQSIKSFALCALPGIIVCLVLWVYNFMGGLVS